jgi:hypothetical protein
LVLKICQMGRGDEKVRSISQPAKAHFTRFTDELLVLKPMSTVTKIKHDLIHKAKVKKAYAKIKAQEQSKQREAAHPAESKNDVEDGQHSNDAQDNAEAMHPTRQLMLKDEDKAQEGAAHEDSTTPDGHRRRTRRPGYYDKQLNKAEQLRAEAEARSQEIQRRREERERKTAERQRFNKAMAKTRDRDGKKKLGRESALLLDRVKKMVGEQA